MNIRTFVVCDIVNTRFLRPFSVITEITTKSPQKLYNRSFFGPFFTPKSFFSPLKSFWPQVLKTRFHFCKHCTVHFGTRVPKSVFFQFLDPHFLNFRLKTICEVSWWKQSEGWTKVKVVKWSNGVNITFANTITQANIITRGNTITQSNTITRANTIARANTIRE